MLRTSTPWFLPMAALALGVAACETQSPCGPDTVPTDGRSYRCQEQGGCTVNVSGDPTVVPYCSYAPVACAPGIVVLGCGCGYYAGGVFQPLPSCGAAACGSSTSCGSASSCGTSSCGSSACGSSCGSSCGSGCGG